MLGATLPSLRWPSLIILTLFSGHAVATAPLEAYGKLPNLENVALSPDGSRLTCLQSGKDGRFVVVVSLDSYKLLLALHVGDEKIRELRWADDDHILIVDSKTALPFGLSGSREEYSLLSVYDLRANKMTNVPRYEPGLEMMNVIAGPVMVRHVDGHTVLFVHGVYFPDNESGLALFRYDLETRRQVILGRGQSSTQRWLVDEKGEMLAQEDYFERDKHWNLKIRRSGHWMNAARVEAKIDVPEVLGFGPKDDSLLIRTFEGGLPVWKLYSLGDGALKEATQQYEALEYPIEDFNSHRMIGGVRIEDDTQYVFFDPALQSRWNSITNAFAGERVRLVSASGDFSKIIVRVEGARHGISYQIVDMKVVRIRNIGDVYDDAVQPLPVKRIDYAAADGLVIPAYLTLPAGKPAAHLPLIVLAHGGPAARDTAEFDWWSQALASQGYAVLQPNFRGSDLNWAFLSAGFGEWGRKMQSDLSDGVRYLAKERIADPARVCIVGASYGGYAALAGASLDSSVYRCAVSIAGVSDPKRFLNWVKHGSRPNETALRYWDRFMGASSADDPALDAISPIKHIDRIVAPILLIHGKDDTVVPFEQSEIMLSELKRAHKDASLVALKREDHWLSHSDTRLQMLQSTVGFLRANNPPD